MREQFLIVKSSGSDYGAFSGKRKPVRVVHRSILKSLASKKQNMTSSMPKAICADSKICKISSASFSSS